MVSSLVGGAIVVLIGSLVAVIAAQPKKFRITRSASMAAPPADVFAQVNDFHNWRAWSPWEKMDPQLERTYEGPAAGVGAMYSWRGNKKVGEGRMTITDSRPGELVRIKLEFLKPFRATNTAEFALEPVGDGANLSWSMTGERNFMFKAMGLIMNMDKMIGGDFERGLANLKSVVEGKPQS